jgi:2-polyprenyl-3-methyl-5-hydroxy-6-metoxy-1,4-benzoquinol methylase
MVAYDQYYQTENLFGKPYPELMEFFDQLPKKGKVLDVGCGQGRDAVPIAGMGYSVVGIDNSKVGIDQMNQIAKNKNLDLSGKIADIYTFDQFHEFDIILLDSIFHFAKRDKEKEQDLIRKILNELRKGAILIICIQDTGKKVATLNVTLDYKVTLVRLEDRKLIYTYQDQESGHKSETNYRMIVVQK